SPHLQIYRLPMAALLSISHRFSGLALSFGLFVLAAWLWALAFSPACYEHFHEFFAGTLGKFCLFGWTLAFFYHMCAGTRHLIWDAGRGFEKSQYKTSNWVVVIAAIVLTVLAWLYVGGGAR
ncbi:MAG TPA: succinate dehydrogenase, cytochrome b556 subunit, partial [Alphaproteobacteria bacterium]|nr:succinate dehydrogenase, cytochrome b556 subunit [Alphaproteobacteria bacterium]